MGKLDLGNAADFAKATLSSAADILGDLTGRNPAEWDILEGSYNGVLFHIFKSKSNYQAGLSQISETSGRRKVKYRFPYKNGQTTDDLGAKPETFDFEILLHGSSYLTGYKQLLAELAKPTPGDLVHPIRGKIRVVPEDVQTTYSSDSRKAVALRVSFIEHSFTVGAFREFDDSTVKGALAKALEAFAKIEAAILNVQGAGIFVNNLVTKISSALGLYSTGYSLSLTRMNRTFNLGSSADIPTLLPVNNGGTSDGTFPVVTSPSDPFASVPLSEEAEAALTAEEVTQEVNKLRSDLEAVLVDMETGDGSLVLYDDILALKETAILLQDVLEKGLASSQSRIVQYTTPRLMSIREVAFANGISVDLVGDIEVLNPALLSVNFIPTGTILKVPKS